jgi:DNA modification methylase
MKHMKSTKPSFEIYHGNCLDALMKMPDGSVDSIVCDPPYGLSFMGRKWDYDVPSEAIWRECLRVLKPGGHLLAFAGTRTQHRMAVRIEDAGFEIRDMIAWVYGSGFPKSLDVSKAIDKAAGAEREVIGVREDFAARANKVRIGTAWTGAQDGGFSNPDTVGQITAPATDAARQWQGWGTALKPALEPITVARKPLIGTVAENVLAHGTGALNIDGCRVGNEQIEKGRAGRGECESNSLGKKLMGTGAQEWQIGRWPANLIHDGSDEVLTAFPQAKGRQGVLTGAEPSSKTKNVLGEFAGRAPSDPRGDTGSAARFFYCAKASKSDRGAENIHPTVKPTDLMRYLCRLVTPPGGVVLDPFMGSGSTGRAAVLEGFDFVGMEVDAAYCEIARVRIGAALDCSIPSSGYQAAPFVSNERT